MANTVLLKRSAVGGNIPTTGQLSLGEIAINTFDGKMYIKRDNGTPSIVQIGGTSSSSVAPQKGSRWQAVAGAGPVDDFEYDENILLFSQGLLQSCVTWVKVPSNYVSGAQILMRLSHYSPGSSNNFKFQSITSLIRKNLDSVNSVTNQYVSTNSDQAVSGTNRYLEVIYDLTNSTGQINSVSVSAGDLLKVTLQRVATTGTDDSNSVRMIPSMTEILFS
jgi:hypothetical protein